MPEAYSEQLWRAIGALMLSGVVLFAFRQAKEAAEKNGRLLALRSGVLWCLGIALLAAFSLGDPSCEEDGDPLHGGCEVYADDGYVPTMDQRGAHFLFWAVLLVAPVVIGVLEARKYDLHPWRKPSESN